MEPDFWLERWREGRTGFHQEAPTPLLLKHWPAVGAARGEHEKRLVGIQMADQLPAVDAV